MDEREEGRVGREEVVKEKEEGSEKEEERKWKGGERGD